MSYITVDSSTSSTTVLIFDEKLKILKKFQKEHSQIITDEGYVCLLYTSPSPRDPM